MNKFQRYIQKIDELQEQGNLRFLRNSIDSNMINVSSNDYLGLKNNQDIYDEFLAEVSVHKYHFTAASSRLLSGNSPQYMQLEHLLATRYNRESALIFNSGYHANCGILPALTNSKDLIIADKLVHASIIDGMRLGNAQYERFRHLDYEHLERILAENVGKFEHIFIVTESVFSMDGDVANIPLLVELKKKYNAFLYVDEAHSFGVYGNKGLGIVEQYHAIHECDFIVGTFGKAIASVGAFVICDEIFKQYMINHARTLIFTTALPPINLAWSHFIIEKLDSFSDKRAYLQSTSSEFANALGVQNQSHIIPYIVGANTKAVELSEVLQSQGFFVLPIRYPTVAKETARLRFSLQANHSMNDLSPIIPILESFTKQ